MIEVGAVYTHKENGIKVIVKEIENTCRGTVIWFVFDDNDYTSTRYARSLSEFNSKFEVSLNGDMIESLNRLISLYGVKNVLNYVGTRYKESII